MSWETAQAPLIFFEDEDEAKLISEFVWWRANHPEYDVLQVCNHIFKNLKDNSLRAGQAAMVWKDDLTLIQRIREAERNGGQEVEPINKESWEAELLALIRNERIGSAMKSSMIAGLKLVGESNGWIVKAVEKKTLDLTPTMQPTIYQIPTGAIE